MADELGNAWMRSPEKIVVSRVGVLRTFTAPDAVIHPMAEGAAYEDTDSGPLVRRTQAQHIHAVAFWIAEESVIFLVWKW